MIRFSNVSKEYPRIGLALNNISFNINKGEFVFLTGPSGAGKSTILRLIYMEEPPTRGEIWVSLSGIERAKDAREVLVLPRQTSLLGVEQVAYFEPAVLDDYLLNIDDIHAGTYISALRPPSRRRGISLAVPDDAAAGEFVRLERSLRPVTRPQIDPRDVETIEEGRLRRRRTVTPEALERALQRAAENGRLGEEYVFASEQTRLQRARRPDLAEQVQWVHRDSVSEGYDILSYETDGRERRIEVKATQGDGATFPISLKSWAVADRRAGDLSHCTGYARS